STAAICDANWRRVTHHSSRPCAVSGTPIAHRGEPVTDTPRPEEPLRPAVLLNPGSWPLGTRFAALFALVAAVAIALIVSLAYTTAATLIRTDVENEFERTVSEVAEAVVARYGSDGELGDSGTFIVSGGHS